jgi:Na+/H+ antiporter NhaA
MIHLLVVLIVADIIWLLIYNSVWSNQYNSYYHKIENMKLYVHILAYIEIGLKSAITVMWIIQYRVMKGEIKELFNFSYLNDLDGYNAELKSKGIK